MTSKLLPVPNCPQYLVDKEGSIYSTKNYNGANKEPRKLNLRYRASPTASHRLHWRAKDPTGKYRNYFVHLVVLQTFVGLRPSKAHVARHLNGDRYDNRLINLKWGTPAENWLDSLGHNTAHIQSGKKNPRHRATITMAQASAIYQLKGHCYSAQAAGLFNTSIDIVQRIWRRERWKVIHLENG